MNPESRWGCIVISYIFNNESNLFCGLSNSNRDDVGGNVDIIYVIEKQEESLIWILFQNVCYL